MPKQYGANGASRCFDDRGIMIASVFIRGAACFDVDGLTFGPLRAVNFVFGANGSGKSTLGRAIGLPAQYSGTEIEWDHDRALSVHTYNADYVSNSFGSLTSELPGVFLLGDDSNEIHQELSSIGDDLAQKRQILGSMRTALGDSEVETGLLGKIKQADSLLAQACWARRADVPTELSEMFNGTKSSKSTLMARVLSVAAKYSDSDSDSDWPTLVAQAASVLDDSAEKEPTIDVLSGFGLQHWDGFSEVSRPIVGSTDVSLAPLIEKLQNSDWVKQGRAYLEVDSAKCPFCQQPPPNSLEAELEEYFDARFVEQVNLLTEFADRHARSLDAIRQEIRSLRKKFDVDDLEFQFAATSLESAYAENERRLQEKVGLPSNVFYLQDTDLALRMVNVLIARRNSQIVISNALIDNKAAASKDLIERAWRLFVHETLAVDIASHQVSRKALDSSRAELETKILALEQETRDLDSRRRLLESKITSSRATIDAINRLLNSVGFRSFRLAESKQVKDGYQLIRADGRPVANTLSEGERTFITFLYYYHRLQSVQNGPNETERLVAVIDDPISSLDSDILFVVSTLVRRLVRDVQLRNGRVEQLFLMTHNAHFHKEVTYLRSGDSAAEINYFLVRKQSGSHSRLELHGSTNPVRTNYTALWAEVARASIEPEESSVSLQNVLRRILENYFRVMGRIDDGEIVELFQGEEQAVCRALLSWINEGSHSIIDEFDYSPGLPSDEMFLDVFRQIFFKSGNGGHYDMMIAASRPSVESAAA